jgi:hypothetical protein
MSKALELIELAHGLLLDLPGCRLWGVDDRARGTHAVLRMAEIVRQMVADGVPEPEIRKRLGMEREEVVRLINRAGMPAQAGAGAFNRAWVPGQG